MAKENTKNLRTVDNAAAYQIVNAAYKQAVGENAVDTLTLDDFTDSGVAYASLTMGRDKFFNALIDQVVNFYNEESYKSEYNDPFYVESRRFANIIQMINAQAPEVQASHAWRDLKPTVDGQGNITYATVGSYEVKQATISTRYFAKSNSWELSISLTEEQLSDAFKSADELRGFVDYLFLIVDNALTLHKETNMMANVSSFIGNKILYSQSQGATGIHVVNLLTKYNAERGGTLATVADFLADADALRFALANGNSPGNDMRFSDEKIEAARNFANKLWNASRFVRMNLTIDEIKELLVNRKWYYTIFEGIKALYVTTSHQIAGRVSELAERYEDTLPSLESDVVSYEAKVKAQAKPKYKGCNK